MVLRALKTSEQNYKNSSRTISYTPVRSGLSVALWRPNSASRIVEGLVASRGVVEPRKGIGGAKCHGTAKDVTLKEKETPTEAGVSPLVLAIGL
jgi:hypothetical protein